MTKAPRTPIDRGNLGRKTSPEGLFAPQPDWRNNACVNWSHDDWALYAAGYREAASVLVRHIEDGHRDDDTLVYPILFLYRQYIELKLKSLIRDARRLLDEAGEYPQHHKIETLWKTCRPLLLRIEPKGEAELRKLDSLIAELSRVDPTSTAFRYPQDKNGGPSLPGMQHINLRHVRDLVEDGADLLDAADSLIDVNCSLKSDYLEVVNELVDRQHSIENDIEELYGSDLTETVQRDQEEYW